MITSNFIDSDYNINELLFDTTKNGLQVDEVWGMVQSVWFTQSNSFSWPIQRTGL